MLIQTLIDKQDNFEVVRDQIASILALEVANQMTLATAAAKDPSQWDLRIFKERFNPFEEFLDLDTEDEVFRNQTPIVNVWYDTDIMLDAQSNVIDQQKAGSTFNIDCYGYGVSVETDEGHQPGDQTAALEAQRALRLVRNILFADINTYLQLRGIVTKRFPISRTSFQPTLEPNSIQRIQATRLSLRVEYPETAPQYEGPGLEYVSTQTTDSASGQVLIDADFQYTP